MVQGPRSTSQLYLRSRSKLQPAEYVHLYISGFSCKPFSISLHRNGQLLGERDARIFWGSCQATCFLAGKCPGHHPEVLAAAWGDGRQWTVPCLNLAHGSNSAGGACSEAPNLLLISLQSGRTLRGTQPEMQQVRQIQEPRQWLLKRLPPADHQHFRRDRRLQVWMVLFRSFFSNRLKWTGVMVQSLKCSCLSGFPDKKNCAKWRDLRDTWSMTFSSRVTT